MSVDDDQCAAYVTEFESLRRCGNHSFCCPRNRHQSVVDCKPRG